MRAFFQKIGQTAGVTVFAMLTLYGKDPHNDLGLRLSGAAGGILCLIAAFAYSKYREEPV
jgi:GPH family glycoside/pentoside/hexuronide:cation symporter